jgi:opacity protein-like surface antigen
MSCRTSLTTIVKVTNLLIFAMAIASHALAEPLGSVAPWGGPSLGVAAIGGWTNTSVTETQTSNGMVFHAFDTLGSGAGGIAELRYDWPVWNDQALFGAVAEIGYLGDSGGQVFQTTTNLLAGARLRAGLAPMPALLLYGETGVAVSNQSIRINFGGPITRQNLTTPGIALGGGAEYALASFPVLGGKPPSLFAEYQHIWWTSDTTDMPAAVPTLNFHWQRDSDIVRAGIRAHF